MNKVSNAQIRELWRAKKGVDERINEGVVICLELKCDPWVLVQIPKAG